MPANPKYLSSTKQRVSKIILATLCGFILSMVVHMAIAKIVPDFKPVVLLSIWTLWIVWVAWMVTVFLVEKTTRLWIFFFAITLLCSGIIYLNQ